MRLLIVARMLVLAVSASVTPANAAPGSGFPKFMCNGAGIYPGPHICKWKCETELWNTAKLWDGTRNNPWSCPPLLQACIATCRQAKEASRR
jgi:hypothetical protein